MEEQKLQSFTMTNLAHAVCRVTKLPYRQTFNELKQYIQPRLDYLNGLKRSIKVYFLFEDSYVETEWKDMIGLHYLNTSYHVKNTVMRVHLFLTDKLSEVTSRCYAGCFTLRNIDEVRIMLSFIYPNWEITNWQKKPMYVMTYRKKVHIEGREIEFHTYPLFVQDNATVRCAQACLVSMSTYLHMKYDYNKIKVANITQAVHSKKIKLFPSWGLDPAQMLEVLEFYKIPVGYNVYSDEKDADYFFRIIDYTIESALPVILGVSITDENAGTSRHVIQIIGHADDREKRYYTIYDDSGCYLKKLGANGFVGVVTREQLMSVIVPKKSCIIYPIHERVYVLYDSLMKRLKGLFDKMAILKELEEEGLCSWEKVRCFVADNREVKEFLRENALNSSMLPASVREEVRRIASMDMPHYLWYCEVPIRDCYMIFMANPTYNVSTTKNIFINEEAVIVKEQLGLLNYRK